jgi:hypothetical protein
MMNHVRGGLLIPLIVVAIGAIAFWFGIRGRRMGNHPTCKRCKFDLFGLPETSMACPECGADLRNAKAACVGRRVRRPRIIWMSCALLVPGLIWTGGVGWIKFRDIATIQYEPVWMLRRAASGRLPIDRDAALVELTRRLEIGKLSKDQIDGIAVLALGAQSDFTQPWVPAWGTFVEEAHQRNALTNQRWESYMRQGVHFEIEARKIVGRGDVLPLRVIGPEFRYGVRARFWWYEATIKIGNGETFKIGDLYGMNLRPDAKDLVFDSLLAPFTSTVNGQQHTRLDIAFSMQIGESATGDAFYTLDTSIPVETSWKFADKAPDVILDVPVADRAAMLASVKLGRVSWWQSGSMVSVPVKMKYPPLNGAFDIIIQADGTEWNLGSFTARKGAVTAFRAERWANNFSAKRIDVILRPSVRAAKWTADLTRIWGEEIVFRDVPVTTSRDTTDDYGTRQESEAKVRAMIRKLHSENR